MVEINKIHLGDCYELIKQIPDKSIDLIYTDIPYLYNGVSAKNEGQGLSKCINKLMDELKNFIGGIDYKILDDFVRVMKKINIFIWCSKEQIIYILNYFKNLGCNFDILIWAKSNPTPMTHNVFLSDLEYCLYFREKGVRLNDGYELKSKWYYSQTNKRDKESFIHPTIKPLDLVERHIKHATNEGDTILDPFMGSGTTALACKETGRNFIGMEIDPHFHKIANDRLNNIDAYGQLSWLAR